MSTSDRFLVRWSRRKRGAAVVAASPEASPAPDLSLLPPIESILAATDIRPFLQAGVPADLTRAALRGAWAADPAIRDFIGIAENQWDFNDPAGIPGFGPLGATDAERGIVGRAVTAVVAEAAAAAVVAPAPRRDLHADPVWLTAAPPAPDATPALPPGPERPSAPRRLHGGALPK
jgi:hypothetical protein